jgi:hypothetical protein
MQKEKKKVKEVLKEKGSNSLKVMTNNCIS